MFDDEGMEEIRQLFVEESSEGLDIMENGLLELKPGSTDAETINNIFRAAHSIKGGGGTFGFMEVSDFTHGVETLLDEVRNGTRLVTEEIIQLFLRSVDCLRGMMDTIQNGGEYDQALIGSISVEIERLLNNEDAAETSSQIANQMAQASTPSPRNDGQSEQTDSYVDSHEKIQSWSIFFKPHQDMVKEGNEPYRVFRELAGLGELEVKAETDDIPSLPEMDPENCYFAWELNLKTESALEEIEEVFAWVSEECVLEIERLQNSVEGEGPEASAEAPAVSPEPQLAEADVSGGTTSTTLEPLQTGAPQAMSTPATNLTATGDSAPNANSDIMQKVSESNAKNTHETAKQKASKESGSVRVSTEKIDNVLDLVGELVITQSMLARFGKEYSEENLEELRDGLEQLKRNARELQESTMQIRMLPIKVVFSRFPRMIRDLSSKLGKKIKLDIQGETTEIDKIVMEKIGDPLVHLVRNAADHGIEPVEVRKEKGKPEVGTITLAATQEAGNVVITIRDDGAGLNKEKLLDKAKKRGLVTAHEQLSDESIYNLIFHPGFSTAEAVSDLSGRGVGMDVVKRNISDLGGQVQIKSEAGVGSEITVRLPLTLAIMDGQLVSVDGSIYIVPLLSIMESVLIDTEQLNAIGKDLIVYHFRDEYIPIISLGEQGPFGTRCQVSELDQLKNKLLVVCECGGSRIGLVVDELSEQQQVVIKTLETNYRKTRGLLGATILGDGRVALIIDVAGVLNNFEQSNEAAKPELQAIA